MESNARQERHAEFRQLAGILFGVLDSLRPMASRTYMLALNAEIAAAKQGTAGRPFGIVAQELRRTNRNLAHLVGEVEATSGQVAHLMTRWLVARQRQRLMQGALRVITPAEAEACAPWKFARARLQELIGQDDAAMGEWLAEIADCVAHLTVLADDISGIARRETHFISVSARIEASRVQRDGGALQAVALDIRRLALDLHTIVNSASDHIQGWHLAT